MANKHDRKRSAEERVLSSQWRGLVMRNGDAQKKVARALAMSTSKMSRCCTGQELPSKEHVQSLCRYRTLPEDEADELLNLLEQAREARANRVSRAVGYPLGLRPVVLYVAIPVLIALGVISAKLLL